MYILLGEYECDEEVLLHKLEQLGVRDEITLTLMNMMDKEIRNRQSVAELLRLV